MAGLAIAQGLEFRKRIYTQGIKNLNDGLSLVNIAEGAVTALRDVTLRLTELAEQGANGSYSLEQRRALDREAHELQKEYNRIVASASFNGRNLLEDGSRGTLVLQDGIGPQGTLSLTLGSELARTAGDGTFTAMGGNGVMGNHYPDLVDLNGDGRKDILGGWAADANIWYSLNQGDGTFGAAIGDPTGAWNAGFKGADVDKDGDVDVLAVGFSTDFFRVYKNDGSLDFSLTQAVDLGIYAAQGARDLALADFDNDGDIDAIAADITALGTKGLTVLRNDGSGTFSISQQYMGAPISYGTSPATGDFNNDGFADIAINGGIFLNQRNGTFSLTQSLSLPAFTAIQTINVADFDHDGVLDLALAAGANGDSPELYIARGNGNGSFAPITLGATFSTRLNTIAVADINGDGTADIIGNDFTEYPGTFFSALGRGDGTFQSPGTIGVGYQSFAVGDVNQDGVTDIVGTTGVLLGDTQETTTMARLDLTTAQAARGSLDILHDQLDRITAELGAIGAFQSRVIAAVGSLTGRQSATEQAEAAIMDSDIAQESANLLRAKIQRDIASSVLSHARLDPKLALKLLKF